MSVVLVAALTVASMEPAGAASGPSAGPPPSFPPPSGYGAEVNLFRTLDGVASTGFGVAWALLALDRIFGWAQPSQTVSSTGDIVMWVSIGVMGILEIVFGILDVINGLWAMDEAETAARWARVGRTSADPADVAHQIEDDLRAQVARETLTRIFNGVLGTASLAAATAMLILAAHHDAPSDAVYPCGVALGIAGAVMWVTVFLDSPADAALAAIAPDASGVGRSDARLQAAPFLLPQGGGLAFAARW